MVTVGTGDVGDGEGGGGDELAPLRTMGKNIEKGVSARRYRMSIPDA